MARRSLIIIAILLLACALRLYLVTNPILDAHPHHWRQGTTASLARHYYEDDPNILHPMESGWGPEPRLFLNEFPIFPYLVSLVYRLTGVREIVGRLLSISFSLFGLYFLFLLAERYLGQPTAVASAVLYAIFPLSIFYARTFQRQSMAICLALGALWFFAKMAETPKIKFFIAWVCFMSLGFLVNPPIVWVGVPMLYLAIHHRPKRWWRSLDFWAGSVAILLISSAWYKYALNAADAWSLRTMERTGFRDFGNPKYYLMWLSKDFFLTVGKMVRTIILTPFGLLLVVLGLLQRSRKGFLLMLMFLLGVFIYFCVDIFPIAIETHDYYYLNAVPALSLCGGMGLVFLWKKRDAYSNSDLLAIRTLVTVGLVSILVIGFWAGHEQHYEINPDWFTALREVDKLAEEDSLIVVDHDSIAFIYYCNREGWRTMQYKLTVDMLENFVKQGADYFLVTDVPGFKNNKPVHEFTLQHGKPLVQEEHHILFQFLPLEAES